MPLTCSQKKNPRKMFNILCVSGLTSSSLLLKSACLWEKGISEKIQYMHLTMQKMTTWKNQSERMECLRSTLENVETIQLKRRAT